MRASHFMLIGLTLFWTTDCFAGPDSNVRYLMNEPVSMFDWGIQRMNNVLEADPELRPANPSVSYSWDKNRIEISLFKFVGFPKGKNSPTNQAKAYCEKLMGRVRYIFGVLPNGKTFWKGGLSSAPALFQHVGFQNKMRPKHLLKGIDEIIDIDAAIYFGGKHPLLCKGPLVGTSIYFKSR